MKRLLLCVCCALISATAMAEVTLQQWLDKHSVRGAQIEVIRVANKKPLIEIEETDAQIDSILKEAEALDDEVSEIEETGDSS